MRWQFLSATCCQNKRFKNCTSNKLLALLILNQLINDLPKKDWLYLNYRSATRPLPLPPPNPWSAPRPASLSPPLARACRFLHAKKYRIGISFQLYRYRGKSGSTQILWWSFSFYILAVKTKCFMIFSICVVLLFGENNKK